MFGTDVGNLCVGKSLRWLRPIHNVAKVAKFCHHHLKSVTIIKSLNITVTHTVWAILNSNFKETPITIIQNTRSPGVKQQKIFKIVISNLQRNSNNRENIFYLNITNSDKRKVHSRSEQRSNLDTPHSPNSCNHESTGQSSGISAGSHQT